MSAPLDYFGHPIKIGDTVVYVGAGYTQFEREVVTKINPKTVTLGDQTQWGFVHTKGVQQDNCGG